MRDRADDLTASTVQRVRRLLLVLTAVFLAVSACSLPLTEEAATTTAAPAIPTTPPGTTAPTLPAPPALPPLDPEVVEILAALPGRLAFSLGPNIGVVNPDGSNAGLIGGGPELVASQPTWSNSGSLLAWGQQGPEASVVVHDIGSGAQISSVLGASPAFYLQWNHTDQLVSYLRNDPNGEGIEAGVVTPGREAIVFDTGAPHYFEWSPDRDIWVSHVGDSRVSIVSSEGVVDLPEPLRAFTTPRWLDPDRVLLGGENGFTILDLVSGGGEQIAIASGPLVFTVSPDGNNVAYLDPDPDPDGDGDVDGQPTRGRLRVLDLETQEHTTVTDEAAVTWEWSPDSKRLAWMGLDRADAANLARVHFWSLEDGVEVSSTPAFRPSDVALANYLPFFTQYAVSHRAWSPDSTAFAFAGAVDGDFGIWVHAIDAGVDAARISTGDVVFWSPDDERLGEPPPSPF